MPFSGKEEHNIETAGWQSKYYVAFTRLALCHFGAIDTELDVPDAKVEIIKQFKRLCVV